MHPKSTTPDEKFPQDQDLVVDDPDNVFDVMAAVRHWSPLCRPNGESRSASEVEIRLWADYVCYSESWGAAATIAGDARFPGGVWCVHTSYRPISLASSTCRKCHSSDMECGRRNFGRARFRCFQPTWRHCRGRDRSKKKSIRAPTTGVAEQTREYRDHPDIAATLHALGNLSRHAGDLKQSEQYCRVSLRMKRSLYRHGDHPEIAVTLNELGNLSWQAGDLKLAKEYYDESLQMKRSWHGDGDHPEIAVTLHALGNLSWRAGHLKRGKQYCDESLRMKRSVHGDKDHPDIAGTLHVLGNSSREAGDLRQTKLYYNDSLRMNGSLPGNRNHPDLRQANQHYPDDLGQANFRSMIRLAAFLHWMVWATYRGNM